MKLTKQTLKRIIKEELDSVLWEFREPSVANSPEVDEFLESLKQTATNLAPQFEKSGKVTGEHLRMLKNIKSTQDLQSLFREVDEILKDGVPQLSEEKDDDKWRYNPLALIIAIFYYSLSERGTKPVPKAFLIFPLAFLGATISTIASGDLSGITGLVFLALCYKYWKELEDLGNKK